MHATIRRFKLAPGSQPRVIKHFEGFVQQVRKVPGFQSYYLIEDGPSDLVIVTVFTDPGGSQMSNILVNDYIRAHINDAVEPSSSSDGTVCALASFADPR
ncbi:MAG: antibiotic biosynthesis monooxygenase [Candidatus Eremiobacteraeota bacterium]|nr:antibiotic biosynthesis monooxygenase [Candidatus Eremiobacteraeota bacterium]